MISAAAQVIETQVSSYQLHSFFSLRFTVPDCKTTTLEH